MRFGRLIIPVLGLALLAAPVPALANHCPSGQPHPGIGDDFPCEAPPGSPPPSTPEPTPEPPPPEATEAPPAPSQAPRPAAPVRRTPAPTVNPIEVTPEETVSVDVPGAVFDDVPQGILEDETERTASATVWIFGFIVGFLIGAIVGRASWGLGRRRRRQQIFG